MSQHVVGIADMKATREPGDSLVTYALGSCLGVILHDPEANVGAMLHVMLPDSRMDPARAAREPFTFVDTALPLLFKACYQLGARKERLTVRVAGGASWNQAASGDSFQIGSRNWLMLRRVLWQNGVMVTRSDVGGNRPRTVRLDVGKGTVQVRSDSKEYAL